MSGGGQGGAKDRDDSHHRGDRGPFEDGAWPEQLTAHAVTPGPAPRLHGYDVQGDLAGAYSFAEIALIALTGEAPTRRVGRAFEVGLAFLAPTSVAEAPAHAATLARRGAAKPASVLAIGALGLTEQAGWWVAERGPLLAWLAAPAGPLPPGSAARDGEDRAAVGRLRGALDRALAALEPAAPGDAAPPRWASLIPDPTLDPSLDTALCALLFACGLTGPEPQLAALTLARLPALAAEALAPRPGDWSTYPFTLPDYRYEPPPRSDDAE